MEYFIFVFAMQTYVISGLTLQSKGCMQFSKKKRAKKDKIFENLGKNVQNLKYIHF